MRRFGLLILSLILALSPSISRGGSYPDRPIRLVVGSSGLAGRPIFRPGLSPTSLARRSASASLSRISRPRAALSPRVT